jgi:hypothetical protein
MAQERPRRGALTGFRVRGITFRLRQSSGTKRDYAVAFLFAAIAGAACDVVGTLIEVGRSASWWP